MEMVDRVQPRQSRTLRALYLVLGVLCLGLAYLSWLPGIPTIDFVVLAAFFFARSSERFHRWIVEHPVFGRILRGYRAGLTGRMKVAASIGIVASLSISAVFLTDSLPLRLALLLVGAFAVWFVLSGRAGGSGREPPAYSSSP